MRSTFPASWIRTIAASFLLALTCFPAAAAAQTEGRVSVGGSVTFNSPTDDEVDSVLGVGPLVRLNPRKGWGLAGALNWYRPDLRNPAGGEDDFARMRVRPLMLGAGYTIGNQPTLITFSIVAGPSFNSIDFRDAFLARTGGSPTIEIENSFAFRPGISVTHTLSPRVAVTGFGGYMVNRPDTVYVDGAGQTYENRWKADSLVLSVGLVYSLF
jgi:hypothetical protein